MDERDVLRVHEEAPDAIIIALHLDAVDHASVTRTSLRAFAEEQGIDNRLLIPEDGESIEVVFNVFKESDEAIYRKALSSALGSTTVC